ncbi:hypothetical protein RV02_GL003515 [Enterococcus gilvus]|nr:hypothetical protein RV02_GL003515 [Enterococcus gilvus]
MPDKSGASFFITRTTADFFANGAAKKRVRSCGSKEEASDSFGQVSLAKETIVEESFIFKQKQL